VKEYHHNFWMLYYWICSLH